MRTIVAISKKDIWEKAQTSGEYTQSTIDSTLEEVGFMHCSTPDQTMEIVNRRFSQQSDVLLLLIQEEKVTSPVKYEGALSGRAGLYPHIYGPLNLDAVYETILLEKDSAGKYITPLKLKEIID